MASAFLAPFGGPLLSLANNRKQSRKCRTRQARWVCATGRDLTLTADDGGSIAAWITEPEAYDEPIPGTGVILMTDVLGHENEETRSYAQTLAEAGIPTIVPDLFRSEPWNSERPREEYEDWRAPHTNGRVAADVRVVAEEMRKMGATSLGMLGFCFGGGRMMDELAAGSDGVDPAAAVAFYPTRFDARTAGRLARCPTLGIFGDSDEQVPVSVVEELQEGLGENNIMNECELKLFEGAGHAFAHHPQSEQDEDDSEILKYETAEWFKKFL